MSDDIRADIEAAMQQGTSDAPSQVVEAGGAGGATGGAGSSEGSSSPAPVAAESSTPADTSESTSAAAQRARDQKGRFAPAKGEAGGTPAPVAAKPTTTVAPAVAATPAETTATTLPATGAQTETLKAPQSWKPAAREHFAKLPAEVQAEVVRREKEAYTREQETAPLRRFAQEFHAVVSPFEAGIRAEGGEPLSAVRELLQTSHALRTAQPAAKAQLVANICHSFGVDIRALDEALARGPGGGQQAQGQGQQHQPPDVRSEVQSAIQELRQQAVASQAQREVAAFSQGKEFLEDVKPLMTALLRSGRSLTLDQAYDEACWASKDIRAILQQREALKAANAQQASTQQARAAASSVKGQAAASNPSPQSGSILDDVMAAHRSLSGR